MSCADEERDFLDPEAIDAAQRDVDLSTGETTRCIYNSTHERKVMTQCDSCKKWVHEDCVRWHNSRESDPFACIFCPYELARSIRNYLRKKVTEFLMVMQKVQRGFPYRSLSHSKPIWSEMLDIMQDVQSVLAMIPLFLPSSDDGVQVGDVITEQYK